MPLYDTLTLGGDKQAVVFEFGYAFTRCGFVNESAPRVILRSHSSAAVPLLSIQDSTILFTQLRQFIEEMYFKYLAVNPRDRKVVIVESVFCPSVFRLTLAKVLFHHLDVPGLVVLPAHLMALNTLIISTAVVVDVGYTESSVTPVIDGVTVMSAVHFNGLAGKAVHENLRQLLKKYGLVSSPGSDFQLNHSALDKLSESVIEDIKVRTCFVAPYSRGQELVVAKIDSADITADSPSPVLYPLKDQMILNIPGIVRESAAQVMFELVGNEPTVATMILDAIISAPLDCRRALAENIVLIGGTTMMTGFRKRLNDELLNLVQFSPMYKKKLCFDEFKFHNLPCPPNYAAWLGSAIYGSTDAILGKTVTSKEFDQSRGLVLTDWSNWWPTARPARIQY